jgi:hypothetical protein
MDLRNSVCVDWIEFIWMRRDTNGGLLSVRNLPPCSARRGKNLNLTEEATVSLTRSTTGQSSWFLLAFTSLCRHGPILLSRKMIEDTPTLKTGIYWLPSLSAFGCTQAQSSTVLTIQTFVKLKCIDQFHTCGSQ